jgi:hypothetical protein
MILDTKRPLIITFCLLFAENVLFLPPKKFTNLYL